MEHKVLRESTGRLERRLKELGRSIDRVMIRSCRSMTLYLFCQAPMLAASSWPSMTCGSVWVSLSLSLIIFAVSCFCFSKDLRLLRRYSAEMERVGAGLSENRRRLLELGMEHEAFLAEIAGMRNDPASTALACGNLLCFVVQSVLVMYAEYTLGCDR